MIYDLKDTAKAARLFEGWEETIIYSCLQGVMGKVLVTDPADPRSACAALGCFRFYAGVPEAELLPGVPDGYCIMVPQTEKWADLIERCLPSAKKITRYATRKDTHFDIPLLKRYAGTLPAGYEMKRIDAVLYEKCLALHMAEDFVSSYGNKERFLELGRGVVILKDGAIVAGASSFSSYSGGIEIEVDTAEPERRKGLAAAACAALILNCLEDGLYPSWDAHNEGSLLLAQKLGYVPDHAYTAYEIVAE